MGQDVRDILTIHRDTHLRSIDGKRNVVLDGVANLVHEALAELLHLDILEFHRLRSVLEFGKRLDMLREVEQGLHLGLTAVEFADGGFELGRDIADELSLQGVALVGQLNVLLLTAGKQDIAHQDDGSDNQRSSKRTGQDKQANDEYPAGC